MTSSTLRVLAVLLASSSMGPAEASIISNYSQPEAMEVDPTPDPGPKVPYVIGEEIRVYPSRPQPQAPAGLEYALLGIPATVFFFILIPVVQRLALRLRLMNG